MIKSSLEAARSFKNRV